MNRSQDRVYVKPASRFAAIDIGDDCILGRGPERLDKMLSVWKYEVIVRAAYLEEAQDVLRLGRIIFGETVVSESLGKGSTLAQRAVRRGKCEVGRAEHLFPQVESRLSKWYCLVEI